MNSLLKHMKTLAIGYVVVGLCLLALHVIPLLISLLLNLTVGDFSVMFFITAVFLLNIPAYALGRMIE